MGKQQKKHSKGRLDRYYYLAKEKGYRARSSFKIVQINEKYGHFLEKSKVVIDLCAAPGSWCQVASQLCPVNSLIIGVDIVPIKPLPNVITFQSDITTEDCRSRLRGHMKTWKADTVLHDGAPNVGLGWVQDAFTQSQLTLQALRLAVENLAAGGTFVTKIFRSRDYNNLMWVFQQLFEKVEATKPPASRNVSAEIFVVCKGFKAPKKLDPRLLDPKEVFEELGTEKQNNEQKIFNPEKFSSQRQRQGYEEGDYTLFHTMPLMEFIRHDDPINELGSLNKFDLPDKDDHEWKILSKLKLCTPELLECVKDLKVLGRKEFKMILKFRKQARDILGLDEEEEKEEIQVEELTEEQKIDKELQEMLERQKQKNDEHINQLIAERKKVNGLSKNAHNFFASDSIFNELGDDMILEEMENKSKNSQPVNNNSAPQESDSEAEQAESDDDSDFEIVANEQSEEEYDDSDDEDNDYKKAKNHKEKVDITTVEAMTLAHQVALGQKNKYDLIEEGINRYSFRDKDNLPEWFLDALAIKEKQKQLNARPIKKVLEAQGRKKMRAIKRLEKIKKKDKADEIQKLMKKLSKKQKLRPKTTVVVARGSNRGLSGRPKGVKGKYKMVDGVMKNEQRALKRIAKKHKK
ncbi:SPB1 AdoMet-dependent rRNA methyltransferase SPB1 [Candida maltosa Xu316]